jgi:hypothetical protein
MSDASIVSGRISTSFRFPTEEPGGHRMRSTTSPAPLEIDRDTRAAAGTLLASHPVRN